MTDDAGLIARVSRAAIGAIKLLGQGIIVLLLGLVAVVSAIAGAAARLTGELLSELARLLQAAIPWLISLGPWLLRAAITVLAVLVIVDAWPALFIAFGADLPAALPASVYAIGPLLAALLHLRSWGALLAAIGLVAALRWLIIVTGPLGQVLIVITTLSLAVVPTIISKERNGETHHERHATHGAGRQAPAHQPPENQPVGLYRIPDVSLFDDDPTQ